MGDRISFSRIYFPSLKLANSPKRISKDLLGPFFASEISIYIYISMQLCKYMYIQYITYFSVAYTTNLPIELTNSARKDNKPTVDPDEGLKFEDIGEHSDDSGIDRVLNWYSFGDWKKTLCITGGVGFNSVEKSNWYPCTFFAGFLKLVRIGVGS